MKTEFVINALVRLKDAIRTIEVNAAELPECAAAIAIRAIAKPAWLDANNLLADFEQLREKEKAAQ